MAWVAHDLGLLTGGVYSIALGASSDGSVIVGQGDTTGSSGSSHAFRWTSGGGMVDLGLLAGGSYSIARTCSADGAWVGGEADDSIGNPTGFYWHGGSIVALSPLAGGDQCSVYAISADGSTAAGWSNDSGGNILPVFWSLASPGLPTNLGLFGSNVAGITTGVSHDGAIFAGGTNNIPDAPWRYAGSLSAIPIPGGEAAGGLSCLALDGLSAAGASFTPSNGTPFIWHSIGGSTVIGFPAGGSNFGASTGISGDGLTVVGQAGAYPTPSIAWLWTLAGGFTILPALGGGADPLAWGISSDALTVVGRSVQSGNQHAVYWRQSGTTVPLRRDLTFNVAPLPYLIPNGPANAPPVPYNWMAATTDIPATASAVLHDPSMLLELNGLQLRELQQKGYVEADYGAPVTSANAETAAPPTAAASWNGQMATSGLRWDSGNVYGFTGTVAYPSTVAATPLASTADVLGFSSGTTAQYSPQPILWESAQYFIMYARDLPAGEPRTLLGASDGNLIWQTIWSGGSTTGGNNAPLWYQDQGGGNNFVLQGGIPSSNIRPTLGLIPSAALGSETYNPLTLDKPAFDAAFIEAAAASGADTPYGQTVPGGWLLPTDDGYFIYLANDASFYDIYRFTSADPIGQQILTNANGLFRTNNARMFLTDEMTPYLIVPPGIAVENAPDLTVLSYPPPVRSPAGGGGGLCGWRGLSGINWKGMALVGDKFSNVVGLSDFGVFQEYGNSMQWLVTSPPIHDDRKRIFVPRFEIEVQAGLGLPGSPETPPLMALDVSKDGGMTWQNLLKFRSMGAVGEYRKRLRWLSLGNARQWVFRLRYSDAARPALIGTYIDMYKGLG